ncbi:MAG: PKD domain-containing protein [Candidatus Kapabacteria bacterium]|nr:PKD domain-containing protein [Candidatus Kapabacteria bacterium]
MKKYFVSILFVIIIRLTAAAGWIDSNQYKFINAHNTGIAQLVVAPDAKSFYTVGTNDSIIKHWDVATGAVIDSFLLKGVYRLISSDCKYFISSEYKVENNYYVTRLKFFDNQLKLINEIVTGKIYYGYTGFTTSEAYNTSLIEFQYDSLNATAIIILNYDFDHQDIYGSHSDKQYYNYLCSKNHKFNIIDYNSYEASFRGNHPPGSGTSRSNSTKRTISITDSNYKILKDFYFYNHTYNTTTNGTYTTESTTDSTNGVSLGLYIIANDNKRIIDFKSNTFSEFNLPEGKKIREKYSKIAPNLIETSYDAKYIFSGLHTNGYRRIVFQSSASLDSITEISLGTGPYILTERCLPDNKNLIVADNAGCIYLVPIIFYSNALKAFFAADTNISQTGDTIHFRNNSAGNPTSYYWDFGDGQSSTDENPAHVYNSSGTYTVKFFIKNTNGSDTAIRVNMIRVFDKLFPDFDYTIDLSKYPYVANFTNKSNGNYTSVYWIFDNTYTSTLSNPSTTYSGYGLMHVGLTIKNENFNITKYKTISIPFPSLKNSIKNEYISLDTLTCSYSIDCFETSAGDFIASFKAITYIDEKPTYSYAKALLFDNQLKPKWIQNYNMDVLNTRVVEMPDQKFIFSGSSGANTCMIGYNAFGDTILFNNLQSKSRTYCGAALDLSGNALLGFFNYNSQSPSSGGLSGFYSIAKDNMNISRVDVRSSIIYRDNDYTIFKQSDPNNIDWIITESIAYGMYFYSLNKSNTQTEFKRFIGMSYKSLIDFICYKEFNYYCIDYNSLYKIDSSGTLINFKFDTLFTAYSIAKINENCYTLAGSKNGHPAYLIYDRDDRLIESQVFNERIGAFTRVYANKDKSLILSGYLNKSNIFKYAYIVQSNPYPSIGFDGIKANFNFVQADTINDFVVQFNDQSSMITNQWNWDFGDGTSSALQNPKHIYLKKGTYSVSLTASYMQYSDKIIKTITINDAYPLPDFSYSFPDTGNLNKVQIIELNEKSILSRKWYFGDGDSSYIQNPEHIYKNPGIYTVRLIVKNFFQTDTISHDIEIVNFSNEIRIKSGPNPADTYLTLDLIIPLAGYFKISIYNFNGDFVKNIFTGNIQKSRKIFNIPVADLREGGYYARIESGGTNKFVTFIVLR